MKKYLVLVFALPLTVLAAPDKIQPRTLLLKPIAYYRQQESLWKEEALRHPDNQDNWLNYYAAATFAQEPDSRLTEIINAIGKAVPNTYTHYLVSGWHAGYQPAAADLLKKAYDLAPQRTEGYGLLQLSSEVGLDVAKRAAFSKRLFDADQISASLFHYSYNVLMSVEPSSILITEGESTTVPLYVLQDVLQIRPDVRILNLDLLSNAQYMTDKLKSLGLSFGGPYDGEQFRSVICSLLPQQNPQTRFYYALTVAKDNLASMKESLYVVGLASLHSVTNVDNVAQIRKNLEKEFLMDYLRVDFNGESPDATGRVLSSNYLVPMLLLYESYRKEGTVEKAQRLRALMEHIAKDQGKELAMAHYLGETTETIPYFPFALDIKTLDGRFRHFTPSLWVEEAEVTNQEYNTFMRYLKANNLTELYDRYDFDLSAYTEPALAFMKSYTNDRQPDKKNKYYSQYPAVNISYEAAVAYCQWLTEQYNHQADRKFKKVKFRLPTVEEFQMAAAAVKDPASLKWGDIQVEVATGALGQGWKNSPKQKVTLDHPEILYPWFRFWQYRNSARNQKSCWLGNFKVPAGGECPVIPAKVAGDGFEAMGATTSYFPNDIGLYDVVGNVAEMTLEKGTAVGGSWNHTPEESTMRSVNTYTKPESFVGFRVFMEILEP
ncbi:MAG: SUMF1/EgtB/PvdO family nonheme iron enzyme [Cyclobacteriaceae bacterium]